MLVCLSCVEQKVSPSKRTAAQKSKSSNNNTIINQQHDGKESAASDTNSNDSSNKNNNNNKTHEEDDRAACCLCHCGLDYSGREAFFEEDRRKELEEYDNDDDSDADSDDTPYYQATDPYVPAHLYDPANALVYCDGCNRLYHQKCHFVPLMVVPRGTWHCLVCSTQKQLTSSTTSTSSNKRKKSHSHIKTAAKGDALFTKAEVKRMFQAPPPPAKLQQYLAQAQTANANEDENALNNNETLAYHTPSEMKWEIATRRAKALLWHKTLTQSVPSSIQSQMSNWRQAQTALETLTQTKQNRQHFLEQTSSSRGSQELAQTLVKMAGAKYKMRQMIMNLEHIRANPEFHSQQIRQWCNNYNTTTASMTGVPLLPPPVATKSMESKNNDTATTMDATVSSTAIVAGKINNQTTIIAGAKPPSKNFMERIIFPFGQFPARSIPRTAEIDNDNNSTNGEKDKDAEKRVTQSEKTTGDEDIPREIITNGANKRKGKSGDIPSNGIKKEHEKAFGKKKIMTNGKGKPKDDASNSDGSSSSGVSLDDAKCCICLIGDATDENDLLLCDGLGCCRAYHMECLEPRVSLEELEGKDDEDWFCPLCSSLAECMHTIQSYYMGEEWDHRREDRAIAEAKKQADSKKSPSKKGVSDKKAADTKAEQVNTDNDDDDDDEDSLKSWEQPDDVFPRSKWEYETALQLKDGKQNSETKALLQLVLGHGDDENQGGGRLLDDMSDGTDDVELDQHFDLDAFHEDRRREYEDGDSDGDSSHSSAATLVDMSSVELKIGKDELNALSDGSDDSSDEDDSDNKSENDSDGDEGSRARRRRQSRRLRKRENQEEATKTVGVDFDSNNIVQGKRRRTNVDYRKLNDSMFGDLNDSEAANLDDKEDFRVQVPRKSASTASSSESDDSESDDDSGSDNDSGENSENETVNSEKDAADDKSDDSSTSPKKKHSKEKTTTSKRKKSAGKRRQSRSDDDASDSGNEAENDDSSVESGERKKASSTGKQKKAPKSAAKKRSPKVAKKKTKSAAKKNGSKSAPTKPARTGTRTTKPTNKSLKATSKQTKGKGGKQIKKNAKK